MLSLSLYLFYYYYYFSHFLVKGLTYTLHVWTCFWCCRCFSLSLSGDAGQTELGDFGPANKYVCIYR
jgi:hypothetical protein